jgi:hypothetical protein
MKKILLFSIMCVCITSTHAQLLKNLNAKVDQNIDDVKARVKEKAAMPDGKDVTVEWNANGRFIEKRVMVK